MVVSIIMLFASCRVATNKITDYGEFHNYSCFSEFWIFPKLIPESAENVKYVFDIYEGLLTPECQVFLEITLPDEEYNKELERIMNVSGELYKIKLDTENYRYPAYVAIDGYNHCYEYVLVDEDQRRFVYVYTEWITNQKNIKFNTEYLPIFWNSTPDGNNFCIYFENIYESTEVPESADDGINY